jgi:hypothetical protein
MADKTKSIKSATDKELDEIIARLRKENEAQCLISDIKRRSGSGFMPYDYGQEISTEKPIESLYHFGIPGMHWRRKKGNSKTIKNHKSTGSEDYQVSRQLKSKGSKNLSTKELKDLTQRLQLEKQYKDLNPKKFQRGINFIKGITAAGTTVASLYAISKTPLGQDIKKAIIYGIEKGTEFEKMKWVL